MEPSSKNFSAEELRCKCQYCRLSVANAVEPRVLAQLQAVREELGEPMTITSAYRCPHHANEAKKLRPGTHARGVAFDVSVPWGAKRMRIVELAMKHGAKGFGFARTFIHLDWGSPQFRSWDYS